MTRTIRIYQRLRNTVAHVSVKDAVRHISIVTPESVDSHQTNILPPLGSDVSRDCLWTDGRVDRSDTPPLSGSRHVRKLSTPWIGYNLPELITEWKYTDCSVEALLLIVFTSAIKTGFKSRHACTTNTRWIRWHRWLQKVIIYHTQSLDWLNLQSDRLISAFLPS